MSPDQFQPKHGDIAKNHHSPSVGYGALKTKNSMGWVSCRNCPRQSGWWPDNL